MKNIIKTLTAIAAAGAITLTGTAYSAPVSTNTNNLSAAAADDNNDDWLHAEGSRLYDMNGNEVWLTGANWFGFNCSENCAHGLYATDVDDFLSAVADHGINIIRFPISSTLLKSWMNGAPHKVSSVQASYNPPEDQVGEDGTITPAGKYGNINRDFVGADGKTLKNSMEIFDIIMQKCKKYGIKAFIDVHSPDENNSGHDYELWYGKASISTKDWIDTLVWIADKYKNDDTLLGYDLKNEPHGKRGYTGSSCPAGIAKWDGSKDENNWAYAAKQCADAILAVNPHALIMIEGVEQYPKTDKGATYDTPDIWDATPEQSTWYGAWWGGNLRGVKDYPVVPESGTSQIVYSPHDYGPSVYAQTWFDKDFSEKTLLDDYWYDTWAYINDKEIAPLLIGEWGGHMDKGKNQKWMTLLRDYMIKHHINHTFWCLNPNSGDTGGLLGNDFKTWDAAKYGLFEESLWQTASGKYIGLDHQKALGANGLSLTQFYASGEKSNLDGGAGTTKGTPQPAVTNITTNKPVTTTTTTTATTTTVTTASTTVTQPAVVTADQPAVTPESKVVYGDANCDGKVDLSDAVLIMQTLSNPSKYQLTEQGKANADCSGDGDGVTNSDALAIQKYRLSIIKSLPEKK
ncbi:MAG: cellulase family glycosylhydrolase [Ruminococcus sp.]|nr:cellulase family glycosylhydrolase [Ruminococcus sp.]